MRCLHRNNLNVCLTIFHFLNYGSCKPYDKTNNHTYIRNPIFQLLLIRFLKSIFKRLSTNWCSGFIFDEALKPCTKYSIYVGKKVLCNSTSNASNRNQHFYEIYGLIQCMTNLLKTRSVEPFWNWSRKILIKAVVFIIFQEQY